MWNKEVVKTERGEFEIFIKGEGKPLCVTHLYSVFNETGDYFAESFTDFNKVYLINLKGSGNSSPALKPSDLSLKESVKDIDTVREKLGLKSWTFAGHSTGGMIGLVYATEFEKSLNGLILVGSAASKEYKDQSDCIFNKDHKNYERLQHILKVLTSDNLSSHDRKELSVERLKFSLHKPEKYNDYFSKPINKGLSAKHLNYFSFVELPNFDVREELKQLQLQSLIICGEHDVQCPLRCSKDLHLLIPQSTLHILKESNHYPFIEEQLKFKHIIKEYMFKKFYY